MALREFDPLWLAIKLTKVFRIPKTYAKADKIIHIQQFNVSTKANAGLVQSR
jgi:hypothetical protein